MAEARKNCADVEFTALDAKGKEIQGEIEAPDKDTALALAVGFRMTPDEADEFLSRAGYAFSPSSRRDAIVRFYLANADWDILGVNSALFGFGEKPLGER